MPKRKTEGKRILAILIKILNLSEIDYSLLNVNLHMDLCEMHRFAEKLNWKSEFHMNSEIQTKIKLLTHQNVLF